MKCELCEREVSKTEKHHLFPKPKKDLEKTINVCPVCHDQLHAYFTNKKLLKKIHSLETLKQEMKAFLDWIKNKPDIYYPIKTSKKRF